MAATVVQVTIVVPHPIEPSKFMLDNAIYEYEGSPENARKAIEGVAGLKRLV